MKMKAKSCFIPGRVIDNGQWKGHHTTSGSERDLLWQFAGGILGPLSLAGSDIVYEEPEQIDTCCQFTCCV